jgi:hypothetical protein
MTRDFGSIMTQRQSSRNRATSSFSDVDFVTDVHFMTGAKYSPVSMRRVRTLRPEASVIRQRTRQ